MAIRGSLKEASLPDVLQLLAMGKKTGCLSVADRSNFGYIFFDSGRISHASIVNRRDRLGDVLVKAGLVSQAQLNEAVAAGAPPRVDTFFFDVEKVVWDWPDVGARFSEMLG